MTKGKFPREPRGVLVDSDLFQFYNSGTAEQNHLQTNPVGERELCMCVCVCMHVYVCVCVCTHVFVCVCERE